MQEEPAKAARGKRFNTTLGGGGTFLLLFIVCVLVFGWSVIAGALMMVFLIGVFLLTNRITVCGNCGNRLDGDHVSICPSCKAELS